MKSLVIFCCCDISTPLVFLASEGGEHETWVKAKERVDKEVSCVHFSFEDYVKKHGEYNEMEEELLKLGVQLFSESPLRCFE